MMNRLSSRKVLLTIVLIIVAMKPIYFIHRGPPSHSRRKVDEMVGQIDVSLSSSSSNSRVASVDLIGSSSLGRTVVDWNRSQSEFDGCVQSADEAPPGATLLPGSCMHTDEVDLRIIILTFNRHASLLKLLNSIHHLVIDGDKAAVEIWIDRDRKTNAVHEQTESAARNFQWRHGRVRVHVRQRHVGLYGQWIDTWRPRSPTTKELALILEDDLSVSPFAYRWIRAARNFYCNRSDIAGVTLQSEGLIVATSGAPLVLPPSTEGPAFLYALVGSWGFGPFPAAWGAFQDWFATIRPTLAFDQPRNSAQSANGGGRRGRRDTAKPFSPLVSGIVMSKWYTYFERQGAADTMWTMWFIYFCSEVKKLYTLYSNLINTMKSLPAADEAEASNAVAGRGCLAVNRREPGLHYDGSPVNNTDRLLTTWKDDFIGFRRNIPTLGFNGQKISHSNR